MIATVIASSFVQEIRESHSVEPRQFTFESTGPVGWYNVAALGETWREKIRIIPETPHVWPDHAAADLFVFTSRIESYPRVILEAMAFGLPIIATPVNGVVEQVRAGVNAEFYEPGDAASLARLIADFVSNPERCAHYRKNSAGVLLSLNSHEDTARILAGVIRQASEAGLMPSRLDEFHPAI